MKKNSKNGSKSPSGGKQAQVRIIGGSWRGRKLPILDKDGLRPTTDRVRETLFNWLMPVIYDANCLDVFSGTGALGFEALSRGARNVTMLEKDGAVAEQLNECKELLKASNCNVINTDSLQWLTKYKNEQESAFDIIFLDPPFKQGLMPETVDLIEQNQLIADGGYIYIETDIDTDITNLPLHWHLHREKKAGQVHYRLYQVETPKP